MPIITLPDGNNLNFPNKVTGLDVAEKISKSLAKQAMVISVNGELKDLDHKISLISKNDPDYLDILYREKFNYVTEDEIIIKLK